MSWNFIFLALQVLLTLLIFLFLGLLLWAVRRDLVRLPGPEMPAAEYAPGRLQILASGNSRLHLGAVLLLQPNTRLGSDPGNDLVLEDPFISRFHARLSWDGVTWWLEDLDSRNGTFLNDVRLPVGQSTSVPPGAAVRLGGMVFRLLD